MSESISGLTSDGLSIAPIDGSSWLFIVQRSSETDAAVRQFVEAQAKAGAPPPVSTRPSPCTLPTMPVKGLGIFNVQDAAWLIIVRKDHANEGIVIEFMRKFGKKIPRPTA